MTEARHVAIATWTKSWVCRTRWDLRASGAKPLLHDLPRTCRASNAPTPVVSCGPWFSSVCARSFAARLRCQLDGRLLPLPPLPSWEPSIRPSLPRELTDPPGPASVLMGSAQLRVASWKQYASADVTQSGSSNGVVAFVQGNCCVTGDPGEARGGREGGEGVAAGAALRARLAQATCKGTQLQHVSEQLCRQGGWLRI